MLVLRATKSPTRATDFCNKLAANYLVMLTNSSPSGYGYMLMSPQPS